MKHYIKKSNGHTIEMTDAEYKKENQKGCILWGVMIFVIIIAITKLCGSGHDNDTTLYDTIAHETVATSMV